MTLGITMTSMSISKSGGLTRISDQDWPDPTSSVRRILTNSYWCRLRYIMIDYPKISMVI